MTTLAEQTRRTTLRVVVTGAFSGEPDLFHTLETAGSPFDVVAYDADVRVAEAHLSVPNLDAVLHVVGTDGEGEAAPTLAADVATVRTHTLAPVILLVPSAHASVAEAALTVGVDDVLVMPQAGETIAFAVRKAQRAAARSTQTALPEVAQGRVLTVFSPKGGTGKTVLATNLGAVLAKQTGLSVLLIDLDLQFGDAAIMLGLDPERTLYELVEDPGALDGAKLARFTTRHKSGLEVLAAPMRPEDAELVTEAKVLRLLEVARESYDVVVVDTSPFFYGPMLALLEPTDHLLVLCGLDVPTLKNVKLSLRTLDQLGFPQTRRSIVLNRVTSAAGLTREDVEEALGVDVRFEIPNDPIVGPAVNRGTVAALGESSSGFAQALAIIAEGVEPAPVSLSPSGALSRRRWFHLRRALEGRTA